MSQDRFLALLIMFHLNNSDAKAAGGQPGYDPQFKIWQLLTHHKISGRLHTGRTADYRQGTIPILRACILSHLYQRKAPQIWDKNV